MAEERLRCRRCRSRADIVPSVLKDGRMDIDPVRVPEWAHCRDCAPSKMDYVTVLQDGKWEVSLWVERIDFLTCEVCGLATIEGRRRCPECLRADSQTNRLEQTIQASVGAAVTAAIKTEREKTMTTKNEGANIKEEIRDGLWRAGAEAMIDTARVTLVEMLAGELPESEREGATAVLAKVLSGKLGLSIVAATAGAAMYTAEAYGMSLPVFDEATSARVGREFRVLAVSSASMTAFTKFVAPLRDLAAARFGSLVHGVADAASTLERAKKIGVKKIDKATTPEGE